MSWSLQVRNGDLTLGGASYGIVTNESKLTQDLRCHVLEHMGTDNMHPEFGSLLDGGTTPDGQVVDGVIGENQTDLVIMEIKQELDRIVREHQTKQLVRAKADKLTYGKATLTPGEVLYAVVETRVIPIDDKLNINVVLQTAGGGSFDIPFSLDTEGLLTVR